MKSKILSSIPILLSVAVLITGGLVAAMGPASDFVIHKSTSITTNVYITGSLMFVLMLAGGAQALLAIRLIWGPKIASEIEKQTGTSENEDDDFAEVRAMKVTGTKKAAVLILLVAVNAVVFDQIGKGILFSDKRAVMVMTLLRSPIAQNQADSVDHAIMLVGDKRIEKSLIAVMSKPGGAREWAAYSAGIRKDREADTALLNLMRTGSPRERSAAATALARLRDDRLIGSAEAAFNNMGDLKKDIIKALGMLGRRETADRVAITSEEDLKIVGDFLVKLIGPDQKDKEIRWAAIWALGRFNAVRGRLPIEVLLEKKTDNATLCIGVTALGEIGDAASSPKLIAGIHTLDKNLKCPELVLRDFTDRHGELICSSGNIIQRLILEVARIGDRRAIGPMEKLSKDPSFPDYIQKAAGEVAFQMKYRRQAN